MDRRTKLLLFILGSLVVIGLVGWFIVWPNIQPLVPQSMGGSAQPPALPTDRSPSNPPDVNFPENGGTAEGGQPGSGGVASFTPTVSPDADTIADLSRRAGVLAERVESGSSVTGFQNLSDAQLDVSASLAATFRAMQNDLREAHPVSGPAYFTIARRLSSNGTGDRIVGNTFNVIIQLQMQIHADNADTTSYRQATVTFTRQGNDWVASGYKSDVFTP